MIMRDVPDHPVIAHALRTGYPPWIKDEPEDEDDDYEHDWECDGDDSDCYCE